MKTGHDYSHFEELGRLRSAMSNREEDVHSFLSSPDFIADYDFNVRNALEFFLGPVTERL